MPSETEVFLACKDFLEDTGWVILGGEAPGGSAHIPRIEIHHPTAITPGSTGSRKVDLIGYRDGVILLLELKPRFDRADVLKLDALTRFPAWRYALVAAFDQRNIFERFSLPKSLRSEIIDGSALHPGIGVGEGQPSLPNGYVGILASTSGIQTWAKPMPKSEPLS